MMGRTIITIGRQFGSGGREVGKMVADQLGIPFYDKELITLAAQESGFDPVILEGIDEKASHTLLSSLTVGVYGNRVAGINDMPINDQLFLLQSNVIKRVSSEGSCVIVGRCADYVLENDPDCVNVFIHADIKKRVKRISRIYERPLDGLEQYILKTDKKRASYFNYYTSKKWGDLENYHLTIDSGKIGTDNTARLIVEYVKMKEEKD